MEVWIVTEIHDHEPVSFAFAHEEPARQYVVNVARRYAEQQGDDVELVTFDDADEYLADQCIDRTYWLDRLPVQQ